MTAPLNPQHPNIPEMMDTQEAIKSFIMYYYRSLLDSGFSQETAKQRVADLLEQRHREFCEAAKLPVSTLGSVDKKLTRAMDMIKEEAGKNPALRSAYEDLLSIQKQLNRRG